MIGRFVVLEGLDGAGTTTQCERLGARLAATGRAHLLTREPTGGPLGRQIRSTLRAEAGAPDRAALPWLFAADRADHLAREIEPALAAGRVVVSDRYVPSSLAYQSVERPLDEIWALNASFRVPDLTLFLEIPSDVGLDRVTARGGVREIFEERERLAAVAERYRIVLDRLRARGDRVVVVDGTAPADAVEREVIAAVEALT